MFCDLNSKMYELKDCIRLVSTLYSCYHFFQNNSEDNFIQDEQINPLSAFKEPT